MGRGDRAGGDRARDGRLWRRRPDDTRSKRGILARKSAVAGAHALGFQGLNVTVPHKEAVVRLCWTVDRTASEVGAVNTLRRAQEGYEGFNTDAPALLGLLESAGVRGGQGAIVLGAGGAARAAVWALLKLGLSVQVAARRLEAAVAMCQHFAGKLPRGGLRARPPDGRTRRPGAPRPTWW